MEQLTDFVTNKYIYIPLLVWFSIQLFKVIWDLVKTKKFNFKRILRSRWNAKFSFSCCNVPCNDDGKRTWF